MEQELAYWHLRFLEWRDLLIFPMMVGVRSLLSLAYLLVVSEMVLTTEGLPTHVAGEGSLVRVRAFVDEEVVALGEVP